MQSLQKYIRLFGRRYFSALYIRRQQGVVISMRLINWRIWMEYKSRKFGMENRNSRFPKLGTTFEGLLQEKARQLSLEN